MAQSSNQFKITNEKGSLTLVLNNNVIDALVASDAVSPLTPGMAVSIKDVAGKIRVEEATALSSDIFGFVPYDVIENERNANEAVKVAFNDCVMVMEASAAIASGAELQFDPATKKVATLVSGNTKVGYALGKASADKDLINVLIKTPGTFDSINVSESLTAAGAVSPSIKYTTLDLPGAGAVTLAAPDASMIGEVKVIEMTTDNGDVTMALTNVQGGPPASTTCTWANVGEALVLVASSTKWNVASQGGVVLA